MHAHACTGGRSAGRPLEVPPNKNFETGEEIDPEGLAGLVCELRGAEQSYNGSLLLQTGIRCGRG